MKKMSKLALGAFILIGGSLGGVFDVVAMDDQLHGFYAGEYVAFRDKQKEEIAVALEEKLRAERVALALKEEEKRVQEEVERAPGRALDTARFQAEDARVKALLNQPHFKCVAKDEKEVVFGWVPGTDRDQATALCKKAFAVLRKNDSEEIYLPYVGLEDYSNIFEGIELAPYVPWSYGMMNVSERDATLRKMRIRAKNALKEYGLGIRGSIEVVPELRK